MICSKTFLGQKLKIMYENAQYNEKMLMIHVFGIKYADIIKENGYTANDIIQASGLKTTYVTELNKGMNISKYAIIKQEKDIF